MKRFIVIFWLFSGCFSGLWAGGSVTAFLQIQPDATSQALGSANQAYSVGAADVFINPALLSQHQHLSLQFTNIADWDLYYYLSTALVYPLNLNNALGIGLVGMSVPGIQGFDEYGNELEEISNYQLAVYLSYARKFYPFALGLTVKYVQMGFSGSNFENLGKGAGFEIGMHYIINQSFSLGFTYRNDFDMYWRHGYTDHSPRSLSMGISFVPRWVRPGFMKLLVGFDQMNDYPLRLNSGLELQLVERPSGLTSFAIRGGVGNFNLETRDLRIDPEMLVNSEQLFTAGAGFTLGSETGLRVTVNYAFKYMKILDHQHVITTQFNF